MRTSPPAKNSSLNSPLTSWSACSRQQQHAECNKGGAGWFWCQRTDSQSFRESLHHAGPIERPPLWTIKTGEEKSFCQRRCWQSTREKKRSKQAHGTDAGRGNSSRAQYSHATTNQSVPPIRVAHDRSASLATSYLNGIRDLSTRLLHDLLHPYRNVETVIKVGSLLEEALPRADRTRRSRDVGHAVSLVGEHSRVALLFRDDLRRPIAKNRPCCNARVVRSERNSSAKPFEFRHDNGHCISCHHGLLSSKVPFIQGTFHFSCYILECSLIYNKKQGMKLESESYVVLLLTMVTSLNFLYT